MREIVLDTETTGLSPNDGHRIVEIACVELKNTLPTGREFHVYINPERDMPETAFAVHGISADFLQDKPLFEAIAPDFLDFIGDTQLVIHNAAFDMNFLNFELGLLNLPAIPTTQAIDTVVMARRKHPGSPASLDALCKRYAIDLSGREKHGALIDCYLLAEVYLELLGGRQKAMAFIADKNKTQTAETFQKRAPLPARDFQSSDNEKAAHEAFLKTIKNPLWHQD